MLIQVAADSIDIIKAPLNLLAQRHQMLLDSFIKRPDIKLGILQEIKQKLKITVACAAADTVYGCVQHINTIYNCLLGI